MSLAFFWVPVYDADDQLKSLYGQMLFKVFEYLFRDFPSDPINRGVLFRIQAKFHGVVNDEAPIQCVFCCQIVNVEKLLVFRLQGFVVVDVRVKVAHVFLQ